VKGQVTIVTGAAQGIGQAISLFLAERGSDIAVFDVIDGAETMTKAMAYGVNARFYAVDVTSMTAVEEAVTSVVKEMGRVDNLVNNAGITRDKLLLRMSEEEWDLVMGVNVKGVFNCTRAVVKQLLRKGGSIVNISSVTGLMGNPGQSNYAASKAAIIGFTKSIAKEYGARQIRVNAVAPGFIVTKMTENLDEGYREKMQKSIPLGRAGDPLDVARVVYFLLSEESAYVTGEVINVSGGLYI
jgi:3-oxoacyl-[acyl-carrier protein] reductase